VMLSIAFSLGMAPAFAQTSQYVIKDAQSGLSFPVNYDISGATISDPRLRRSRNVKHHSLLTRILTPVRQPDGGHCLRPAGNTMGQAGPAGRNHPADRDRQIEAGHRKIPLGPDRRHGVQPGRRKSRDRRGDGRVPNTRLREAGTWRRRCRLATRFGCELLHIGALGVR
jgi:hypothetical protein